MTKTLEQGQERRGMTLDQKKPNNDPTQSNGDNYYLYTGAGEHW